MVYSQAKVIAGGLAHIPIVIGVFYFIMTFFNKRAIEYAEANKPKKVEKIVKKPETKSKSSVPTKVESKVEVQKTTSDSSEIKTESPKNDEITNIEKKPMKKMKQKFPIGTLVKATIPRVNAKPHVLLGLVISHVRFINDRHLIDEPRCEVWFGPNPWMPSHVIPVQTGRLVSVSRPYAKEVK